MSDLTDWTPERLRALDVAVAEARLQPGSSIAWVMPEGEHGPRYPSILIERWQKCRGCGHEWARGQPCPTIFDTARELGMEASRG